MLKYEKTVSIERQHRTLTFDWHNQKIEVMQGPMRLRRLFNDNSIMVTIFLNNYIQASTPDAYVVETFDLDSHLAITIWNELNNSFKCSLVNQSGRMVTLDLGANYIKYLPVKFVWCEYENKFYYPKIFQDLLMMLLFCLQEKKLPRRVIIKHIFELVWNNQRQNILTEIFNDVRFKDSIFEINGRADAVGHNFFELETSKLA